MAKAEWGTKRVCLNCSARFYDMLRDPIVCPSCETVFDPTANLKTRRSRPSAKSVEKEAPKKKAVPVEDEEDLEIEDEEEAAVEDGDLDEDDDELDDGDEDNVARDDEDDEDDDSESAIEDVSELGDDDVSDVIDADVEDEDNAS